MAAEKVIKPSGVKRLRIESLSDEALFAFITERWKEQGFTDLELKICRTLSVQFSSIAIHLGMKEDHIKRWLEGYNDAMSYLYSPEEQNNEVTTPDKPSEKVQ